MPWRDDECLTDLTVLIPVFNESGSAGPLLDELRSALEAMRLVWEIIWIDDGSTDDTAQELQSLFSHDLPLTTPHQVRVLRLFRRRGQSTALWTGLQAARGNVIVTIDGDGQNDPADIPRLLDALAAADMVVGHRRQRRDAIAKLWFAKAANAVRNALTGSQIPDSGCGLKAFRRHVVPSFLPFEGMHRFLPTMAEIAGYRVVSIDVNHRPRRRGRSKYGIFDRLIGPLLDCLMLRRLKKRRLLAAAQEELRRSSEDNFLVAPEPACTMEHAQHAAGPREGHA